MIRGIIIFMTLIFIVNVYAQDEKEDLAIAKAMDEWQQQVVLDIRWEPKTRHVTELFVMPNLLNDYNKKLNLKSRCEGKDVYLWKITCMPFTQECEEEITQIVKSDPRTRRNNLPFCANKLSAVDKETRALVHEILDAGFSHKLYAPTKTYAEEIKRQPLLKKAAALVAKKKEAKQFIDKWLEDVAKEKLLPERKVEELLNNENVPDYIKQEIFEHYWWQQIKAKMPTITYEQVTALGKLKQPPNVLTSRAFHDYVSKQWVKLSTHLHKTKKEMRENWNQIEKKGEALKREVTEKQTSIRSAIKEKGAQIKSEEASFIKTIKHTMKKQETEIDNSIALLWKVIILFVLLAVGMWVAFWVFLIKKGLPWVKRQLIDIMAQAIEKGQKK